MDNPLTPNKIQRLMHLAEDKSFNMPRRLLLQDEDTKRSTYLNKTANTANYESSSGILDLEHVEGFGDNMGNVSLSKSTAFNPGEMTGRSTGTDEINSNTIPLGPARTYDEYGRYSLTLDSITSHMDKQTSEINDILRHSIATNYSFHSKRDLTADEASLVMREAPIPTQQKPVNFQESIILNNSNLSVGAYFKNRCEEFGKILGKTDSPDRSLRPSISEVSTSTQLDQGVKEKLFSIDESLDCIPVRQPRNPLVGKVSEQIVNNLHSKTEKFNNYTANKDKQNLTIDIDAKEMPSNSKVPEKQFYQSQPTHKPFLSSAKPTDILIKNLQASLRIVNDNTEESVDNSFSISRIADYLGKQSNVSVTDMLQLNPRKQINRKHPLSEINTNAQEKKLNQGVQVTYLKDARNLDTASSSGTVNTVISLDKGKNDQENNIPEVIVTQHTLANVEDLQTKQRSKSPSSKSRSTLSTVQERTSFKASESPLQNSKGEVNISHIPSPNVEYKELDKSVDWHEVLQQKRVKQEGLAKEQWVEIETTAINGFVGVNCSLTISVTTLINSWLTPKFKFEGLPNNDLSIELARPFPLLLSPGKSEQFTVHLTSCKEMNTAIPFTLHLSDSSNDRNIEQMGEIAVNIKMPTMQIMSSDGFNRVLFPPIQEKSSFTKSFVLISDCPGDLQLDLLLVEGDSVFSIRKVQEIKKNDVNKVICDPGGYEDQLKVKGLGKSRQVCRLTSGNAIQIIMTFNAPRLSEVQLTDNIATFNGAINVSLIGVNTVLKRVGLTASVGCVNLVVKAPAKLQINNESSNITVCNTGSISGVWIVKFTSASTSDNFPFKVSTYKFEIQPGGSKVLTISYLGSGDSISEATMILEDISTNKKTTIEIFGGTDQPKTFPIKTNLNNLSWVRVGRKELSLKNSTDKKLHIRCQIIGEGFAVDLPGDTRGPYCLPFEPNECRSLPIIFSPNTGLPYSATLHLVYDKNSDFSRKVTLHGCAGGEALRWSGLVTYGDTALVRAVSRQPIALKMYNKSCMPVFVAARVHFNLQYMSVEPSSQLQGAYRVVPARCYHTVSLNVDWSRVERRARDTAATTLATLNVLSGGEVTRRRILKIFKDESSGHINTPALPENLKILAGQFEGQDPSIDNYLVNFKETKASLNELIGGLQELTAQIDLPQDFADENTILITDDTVVEHHTLRE